MQRRFVSSCARAASTARALLLLPLLPLLLLLATPPRTAHAQTLAWAARYNGPHNDSDVPADSKVMAVDVEGNVYVAGSSNTPAASYDWVIIKYSSSGERQWIARYNGIGNGPDSPNAITVDAQGGVYVTGYSIETPGSVLVSLTTIKYGAETGQQVWKRSYRGPATSMGAYGNAVAVHPQQPGSVFVTGHVDKGVSATSAADSVTLRYDTGSGAQRWVALYNGTGNSSDVSRYVAADASGNCYVTGYSVGAAGDFDYLTIKYGASTGQAVWTQRYNGPGNNLDFASGIVVDAQGNVGVTGYSYGLVATGIDYATIKYNGTSGAPIWTKRYDNAPISGSDTAAAIGADGAGNIYVTGSSYGGAPATPGNTNDDYATIKYDTATGAQLWVARYDGGFATDATDSETRGDRATTLTVDSVGNVYVTGHSYGGLGASGGTIFDIVTLKYNRSGARQWVQRHNTNVTNVATGSNYDYGYDIALDAQGYVYVSGSTFALGSNTDILTLKYSVGSIWNAQDIAVGSDNKTRFLWNRNDDAIALWTVSATGVIEASKIFGPYPGLQARALAMGSDNKPRVLWYGGPGKATVWTVKADLSAPEAGYNFTAAGFYPWEIAVGRTDNKTRISWYDANNRVAIWTLTGSAISQNVLFNQPTGGYVDQAIAVGADNRVRLLWNSQSQAKAALWTLNATTLSTIDSGYSYGPLNPVNSGWLALDMAVGADNKPRVLWNNNAQQVSLWQIASGSATIEKGITLGPLPLPGWVPSRISYSDGTGSDNNVRLLWTAPTGAALLYTVNPLTGAVVRTNGFGPL